MRTGQDEPVRAFEKRSTRPRPRSALGRTVAADLFPEAPPRRRICAGGVATAVGGWAVLVGLSLFRQRGVSAVDTIWAEDGAVFLAGARDTSPLAALGTPYAGYLNVVPRLAAELVALVPVPRAATALALAGAAITAACAVLVYFAAAGHVRSRALRTFLASMVVLQPAAAVESLNAIALSQWHLVFAGFWLSLWRPARASAAVVAGAVLVLTVLSGPLALLLGPVLALRALLVPERRERVLLGAFAVAAAVQGWVLLTAPQSGARGGSAAALWRALTERVAVTALFGINFAGALVAALGRSFVDTFAVVALLVAVAVGAVLRPSVRLTLLLAVGLAVVSFVGSAYLRGAAGDMVPEDRLETTYGSRFVLVPILLLLSAVLVVLGRRPGPAPAAARWERVRLGVVGYVLFVAGADFLAANGRGAGPSWRAEVARAAEACRQGVEAVEVPTAPNGGAWRIPVGCGDLPR